MYVCVRACVCDDCLHLKPDANKKKNIVLYTVVSKFVNPYIRYFYLPWPPILSPLFLNFAPAANESGWGHMAGESASPSPTILCRPLSALNSQLSDSLSIINIFYASQKCFCFTKKEPFKLFHALWKYSIILLVISYVFETKYNFNIDSEFPCSWRVHWFPLINKTDNPLYIDTPLGSVQTNAHNTIPSDTTFPVYQGPCVRYNSRDNAQLVSPMEIRVME